MQSITWDDVPHLDEEQKATLLAAIPPHLRDARTKGVPQIGAGAIYPVPETEIVCEPFQVPDWFRWAYGLDVGWNRTAVVWGALDPENDVLYLTAEHYRGRAEPFEHAQAIIAKGDWIPGVVDPASRGRGQKDGEQLLALYRQVLPHLTTADNAVEAGLYDVWIRLNTGRLKVFKTLQHWLSEFRIYRRDEKGQVVKENDHLMDACVVGGTMVCTDRGPVAIAHLVGHCGMVLTRSGTWAHYVGARRTIKGASVIRVAFDNGSAVVCTPDHPFLTPHGWRRADEMEGQFCYNSATQRRQIVAWFGSLTRPFKSLKVAAITCAADIFSAMASAFTGLCGSVRTAAASHQVGMCTTSTTTDQTMSRATLRSLLVPSTRATIKSGTAGESQMLPLRHQKSGTRARPAVNGIGNITAEPGIFSTEMGSSVANSAVENLPRATPAPIGSALTHVRHGIVSRAALTMRNAVAWCAAAALWQIATWRNGRARGDALARCLRVSSAGQADVYCLTVPGTCAFAVEGGLVVHNTRYLVRSGIALSMQRPAKQWRINRNNAFQADYDPFGSLHQVR